MHFNSLSNLFNQCTVVLMVMCHPCQSGQFLSHPRLAHDRSHERLACLQSLRSCSRCLGVCRQSILLARSPCWARSPWPPLLWALWGRRLLTCRRTGSRTSPRTKTSRPPRSLTHVQLAACLAVHTADLLLCSTQPGQLHRIGCSCKSSTCG